MPMERQCDPNELKILFSRLEDRYKTRNFDDLEILKLAAQLLEGCFLRYRDHREEFTPTCCEMLAGAIEVLTDYFDRDVAGEIYEWLFGGAQKIFYRIIEKYEYGQLPQPADVASLVHEIRFTAAGGVNVKYRFADYDQSIEQMVKLIVVAN